SGPSLPISRSGQGRPRGDRHRARQPYRPAPTRKPHAECPRGAGRRGPGSAADGEATTSQANQGGWAAERHRDRAARTVSIALFDTSCLVKLLIHEPDSEGVEELWMASDPRVCSRIVYGETWAAVARAQTAGRLTIQQHRAAKRSFERLWREVLVLEVAAARSTAGGNLGG